MYVTLQTQSKMSYSNYRLVSLWDMLQLPIAKLLTSVEGLSKFVQVARVPVTANRGFPFGESSYAGLLGDAESFCVAAEASGLTVSASLAKKAKTYLEKATGGGDEKTLQSADLAQACHYLQSMLTSLEEEAAVTIALMLPPGKARLYEAATPLFGQKVADQFPCLSYEIEECGKCLALGRSTAAVFHAVRTLEAGFAAVWRCLGVADPISGFERNWSNRKKKVVDQIELRWPASSGRMSGDAQLFDEILAALSGVQNPYRNNTMHLDQVYTEDDATHIVEVVKGFMQKIASRMNENGDPKV